MFHDRRMNSRDGQPDPRIATELRKQYWARKAVEGRRLHEIELLLNANVPLAEAIVIVDGTNVTSLR